MCRKICFGIVAHCSNAFLFVVIRIVSFFVASKFLLRVMFCSPISSLASCKIGAQPPFFLLSFHFNSYSYLNGMRKNRAQKKNFLVICSLCKQGTSHRAKKKETSGNTLNMLHGEGRIHIHKLT